MNLDELRSVQNRERQKDSLQHLRDSFYEEVGEYISELKAERERAAEQTDDPFSSPEVRRLTDEIETAEEVAESVYERRMGKLVKDASLAAAGYATDTEGLTLEEEALFEDLVERIEDNKSTVLDVLAGRETVDDQESSADASGGVEPPSGSTTVTSPEADEGSKARATAEPAVEGSSSEDAEASISAARVMGDGASEPADATGDRNDEGGKPPSRDSDGGAESESTGGNEGSADRSRVEPPDHERTTVRITSDVGEILGVDAHEYDLTADTVVTLPEANAGPLIERDVAEPIE